MENTEAIKSTKPTRYTVETRDYRYEIPVEKLSRAMRTPRELSEKLKGALSKKKISQMKKEAVDCPVLGKKVSFLQCFFCPNFVRRVRGIVYCRGEPLEGADK